MPTVKELLMLIDEDEKETNVPAVDVTIFPNTPSQAFWSSSVYAGDPAEA